MPPSEEVRSSLVAALRADLVGPFDANSPNEVLTIAPSRWYLTGFLAPQSDRETKDPTADEEFGTGTDDGDDENDPAPEPEPKQKNHFPASLGVSVFLPPPESGESITATVSFAEYVREERAIGDGKRKRNVWRRVPQPPRSVEIPLNPETVEKGCALPDTPSIRLCGKLEAADAPGLPQGTRALSLFVVNERTPNTEKGRQDEQFIFQVEMELAFDRGFVARPNRQGEGSGDPDDETADLQFRMFVNR